jgi:hypothetical protein
MLTESTLKANSVLATLTPEQISAITTLSQNDENQVIAGKYGEIYGGIDIVIEEITGEKKPQGVKTTDWTKTKLSDLKAKADKSGDNTELDKLKTELAQAKEDAKNNSGDKTLKAEVDRLTKEVADERQRVKDLQENSTKTVKEWEEKVTAKDVEMINLKLDNEANAALAGMKFKDEKIIPSDLRQIAINAAKAKILAENKADWIDDGNGGKRLVFRDANGQVRNNPENKLEPFNFGELLSKELSAVVDNGHQQQGGGTKPPTGGGGGTTAKADFSGVKSKTEATDRFNQHWMKVVGKPMTDPDYNKEYQEAFKELPADLPLA